jgi:hypothetical protein
MSKYKAYPDASLTPEEIEKIRELAEWINESICSRANDHNEKYALLRQAESSYSCCLTFENAEAYAREQRVKEMAIPDEIRASHIMIRMVEGDTIQEFDRNWLRDFKEDNEKNYLTILKDVSIDLNLPIGIFKNPLEQIEREMGIFL